MQIYVLIEMTEGQYHALQAYLKEMALPTGREGVVTYTQDIFWQGYDEALEIINDIRGDEGLLPISDGSPKRLLEPGT